MSRRGAAIAAALATLVWASASAGDLPVASTSYATPTPSAMPTAIAGGYDGSEWFLEGAPGAFRVGAVTAGGTVTESASGPLTPEAITPGVPGTSSAGAVWVAVANVDQSDLYALGPLATVAHSVRLLSGVTAVAGDSAGVMWLADPRRNAIYTVAPPYTHATPGPSVPAGAQPTSVAAGPGGTTLWFTDAGSGEIGEVSSTGTALTQFPLPSGLSGTLGNIVLGPDGNLWVGLKGASSAVLRVTPAGVITAFATPAGSAANVDVLGAGPDGALWMAGGGTLESLSTAGTFTQSSVSLPAADAIGGIAADAGGADALWLTDTTASALVKVTLKPPPPPALTASIGPVSAVAATSVTLAGTIAATGPAQVTYHFEYGTSTAYGSATAPASTPVGAAGVTVSAPVSGLAPFTTYHYRLVASDCTAASCQTASADQTFTTGTTLQPAFGSTVGVAPVSGQIAVRLPGRHRFKTLAAGATLPLGSAVDARHGVVLIVAATSSASGEVASGQFSGGVFAVTQHPPSTFTVLALISSYSSCPAPIHGTLERAARHRRRHYSARVINQVFGNAHGQFKTRGHYATAADQGTAWRASDRCDGTQIAVSAGSVTVTDFARHRTVVLGAGHRYLARRP